MAISARPFNMGEISLDGQQNAWRESRAVRAGLAASAIIAVLILAQATPSVYSTWSASSPAHPPTAVDPDGRAFYEIAHKAGTDKVTTHRYDAMYGKYLGPARNRKIKLLEIGLGCDMSYGPGASLQTWSEYLPNVDLHFMEYNKECVDKWESTIPATIHTGDQANHADLERLISKSGANFDFIIDDGGHTMHQQKTSFDLLFDKALRPGGVYFIEDLQTSYWPEYSGGQPDSTMEMIKSMLDDLSIYTNRREKAVHRLSKDVLSIDCMEEVCALTKRSSARRPEE